MNIYVESNFILELALLQEQSISCIKILDLCQRGKANLALPAFSIAELYETLGRRSRERNALANRLDSELRQLSRTQPYTERINMPREVTGFLVRSAEEERSRLKQVMEEALEITEVIPLDSIIITSAYSLEDSLGLSPQDAIVLASVFKHLEESNGEPSCFLNRNAKDFDDPDIVKRLGENNCKLLPKFDDSLRYIRNVLGIEDADI
jgi:predicted nucleic acid-binding protein